MGRRGGIASNDALEGNGGTGGGGVSSFSLSLAWLSDFVDEKEIRPSSSIEPRPELPMGEGASSFATEGDDGLGADFLRSRMKENIPLPFDLSFSRSLDLVRLAFVEDLDSDSVFSCRGSRDENCKRGAPNLGMVALDLIEVGDVGRVESEQPMDDGEMGKWEVEDSVGDDGRGTESKCVGTPGRCFPPVAGLVGELS